MKEATYFAYLVYDKKMSPFDVAELFQMSEKEVRSKLAKAIRSSEARKIITDHEMYELGRPLPGKVLEAIASAPLDKQPALAKAVVQGRLKPSEVEAAKEAILQGAPIDEAIEAAKSSAKARMPQIAPQPTAPVAPSHPPAIAPAPVVAPELPKEKPEVAPPAEELEEIVCPKCGAKAKVDWKAKKILWT